MSHEIQLLRPEMVKSQNLWEIFFNNIYYLWFLTKVLTSRKCKRDSK